MAKQEAALASPNSRLDGSQKQTTDSAWLTGGILARFQRIRAEVKANPKKPVSEWDYE